VSTAAAAASPARPRSLLRWAPWVALLAVAVAALVIGAQRHEPHRSLRQETMSLAGRVRCPVCQGETVAESQTPESVAIRQEIRGELRAGERPGAILAGLAAAYGPGILEKPQARGADLLLWVLPAAAAAAGVAGLATAFGVWRRRRRSGPASRADRDLVAGVLTERDGP